MAGDVAEKVGEDCNVEDGRMGGGGDSGPDGEGDIDLLENGERRDEAVSSSHLSTISTHTGVSQLVSFFGRRWGH
jgi:hypothetical protein